ncbi:MAG TPA: methyltransferase domain-containing protein [Acidimicrobiia bacterium]
MSDDDLTEAARDLWDGLGSAWDRHRDHVFAGFLPASEWIVDRIEPRPGATILELAAGPGETGFLAADRIGPEGRLISTDLAPAMVEAARRGAEARGLSCVECHVMDAQDLELPDDSVDGVISRLGLMLTPQPARAFREIRRVLRPGGRLAYAVMGAPERNAWVALMMGALIQNGHVPPGDPFGPGGVFSLSAPDRNQELLTATGFSAVTVREMEGVMEYAGFDAYWAVQTAVSGPVPALVASLPADEAAAVRSTLEATLEPFRSATGYSIPTLAVVAGATA